jgi:predicted GNAT family acetyltransferase
MADTTDPSSTAVVNNERAGRFELHLNGHSAILTYRFSNGSIFFDHTVVPPAIAGRGVATKLTQTALEFARSKHLRVVPICPFVASYIGKHMEYHDLLAPLTLKRLLG